MNEKISDACIWIAVGAILMFSASVASDAFNGGAWWNTLTTTEKAATWALPIMGAALAAWQTWKMRR